MRKVFCLFLLLAALSALGDEWYYLNYNTQLDDSTGQVIDEQYWTVYNAGDEPFGAYMGWMQPGFTTLNGEIPLNTTLSAGVYNILLKATEYGGTPQVTFTLGDGVRTFIPNNSGSDAAWRANWQNSITITSTIPATVLGLDLTKTAAIGVSSKILIRAVVISQNTNLGATKFDYLVDLAYPASVDDTVQSATNVVLNSSFEVGMAHHWHSSSVGVRTNILAMLDTATVQHGLVSAKCRYQQDLLSRVYRLKPNKKYTFSAYVRSVTNGNVRLSFDPVLDIPTNYVQATLISPNIAVNNAGWTRVSYTTNALDYPEPFYKLRISPGTELGLVYVDSVMLTEGDTLLTYAENPAIDVGIKSRTNNNIILDSESVTFDFLVRNPTATSSNSTFIYQVRDYLNTNVYSNTFTASIAAATTVTQAVTLSPFTRYGAFRLVAWPASAPQMREEIVFHRLHTPRTLAATNSMFGSHPNHIEYYTRGQVRAGMPWVRTLSPGSVFSWQKIEPSDNTFVWDNPSPPADYGITNYLNAGAAVLGVLFEAPTWAKTGDAYVDQAAWTNYIGTVVNRYKNVIKYWEVQNEPNFLMSFPIYATNLRSAHTIIKQVDPTAQVVGFGGMSDTSHIAGVRTTLGSTWTNYFDIASVHVYPGGESKLVDLKNIVEGKPIWNDESGAKDMGFLVGLNHDENLYGTHAWGAAGETKWRENGVGYTAQIMAFNMLTTLGNGYAGWTYYDNRAWGNFNDHQYSMLESDDSYRTKAAMISACAFLIDGCDVASTTNVSSGSNYAFLFKRGTTPVGAFISLDLTNRNAGVNLATTDFNVFDWMGNMTAATSTNVPFGPWPTYIEGTNGLTFASMLTALKAAVFSTKPDTNAPRVSIIQPHRTAETNTLTMRWFAVDEVGYSTYGATNVLFSYKLDNVDADWSGWSNIAHQTYTGITTNLTYFHVRAKDNPGNTSAVETLTLSVQADEGTSPPATLKSQRRRGRSLLF